MYTCTHLLPHGVRHLLPHATLMLPWQLEYYNEHTCCHTLSATSFHTMTLPSNEAVASRLPNLGCAQHTCRQV